MALLAEEMAGQRGVQIVRRYDPSLPPSLAGHCLRQAHSVDSVSLTVTVWALCVAVEGVNAISGERCSPHPHVYTDRVLRPGDPAYFDILQ